MKKLTGCLLFFVFFATQAQKTDKDLQRQIENLVKNLNINKLVNVKLFDVFESEKIGLTKKSYAISFTFIDKEKTLTDKETDAMMNKIVVSFETGLSAEIRK